MSSTRTRAQAKVNPNNSEDEAATTSKLGKRGSSEIQSVSLPKKKKKSPNKKSLTKRSLTKRSLTKINAQKKAKLSAVEETQVESGREHSDLEEQRNVPSSDEQQFMQGNTNGSSVDYTNNSNNNQDSEAVLDQTEEMNLLEDAQVNADINTSQKESDDLKFKTIEAATEKSNERENSNMSPVEKQVLLDQININEAKTPHCSHSDQKMLYKVEYEEAVSEQSIEMENSRGSPEETPLVLNQICIKEEPLEAVSEINFKTENSYTSPEERVLNKIETNENEILKTLDECQTQDGFDNDQSHDDKVKTEPSGRSSLELLALEKAENSKTLFDDQTQCVPDSDMNKSGRENSDLEEKRNVPSIDEEQFMQGNTNGSSVDCTNNNQDSEAVLDQTEEINLLEDGQVNADINTSQKGSDDLQFKTIEAATEKNNERENSNMSPVEKQVVLDQINMNEAKTPHCSHSDQKMLYKVEYEEAVSEQSIEMENSRGSPEETPTKDPLSTNLNQICIKEETLEAVSEINFKTEKSYMSSEETVLNKIETNENEILKTLDECQTQDGFDGDQSHDEKVKTEPSGRSSQLGNVDRIELLALEKAEVSKTSIDDQTQCAPDSDMKKSGRENSDLEDQRNVPSIDEQHVMQGNNNGSSVDCTNNNQDSEAVLDQTEEINLLEDGQDNADINTSQKVSDDLKFKTIEAATEKNNERENSNMSPVEKQVVLDQININEAKTPHCSHSDQKMLYKVEYVEAVSEHSIEMENSRGSPEETPTKDPLSTNLNKICIKEEPLEAVSEVHFKTENSYTSPEERVLNKIETNENEILKTLDECQTQDGYDNVQSHDEKVKTEPSGRSSQLGNVDKIELLALEKAENSKTSIDDQTQCAPDSDMNLSDNCEVECKQVTQSYSSQSESEYVGLRESEMSRLYQTHTSLSSEHSDNKNFCENSIQSTLNYPSMKMDISDEEVNNEEEGKEQIATPCENYKTKVYESPLAEDPVWRDRLPPPPGCESPPPPAPVTKKIDKMLVAQGYNIKSTLNTADVIKSARVSPFGRHEIKIEINNLPRLTVDYLTKHVSIENCVENFSGATVIVKESDAPPGHAMSMHYPKLKLLHLYINGPSQQSLELALKYITKLIAEGEEDADILVDKMFVEITNIPAGFKLNERIMGVGGANLLYITDITGAETTLRGLGSRYLEINSGQEAPLPLHIRIRHTTSEGLTQAKELAANLLQNVRRELNEFCSPGQLPTVVPSVYPVPAPGQLPTGVPSVYPVPAPTLLPIPPSPADADLSLQNPPQALSSVIPLPVPNPGLYMQTLSVPIHTNTGLVSAPYPPVVTSDLTANPVNPLRLYNPVAQVNLADSALLGAKVVYEAAPQLKNQTILGVISSSLQKSQPNQSRLSSNLALQAAAPFDFVKPAPPGPKPRIRALPPPPLRNPPSATPPRVRPSSSAFSTPDMRNALTFRPQLKKENNNTEVDKSTVPGTLKSKNNKPNKIQFTIVTGAASNKVTMIKKNILFSKTNVEAKTEDQSKVLSTTSGAKTESSSSLKKERKSRWSQESENSTQINKINRLLIKAFELVKEMKNGRDKLRLEGVLDSLRCAWKKTNVINDNEHLQMKSLGLIELIQIQKTLTLLPSNQLSKTLWEVLTIMKSELKTLTEHKSTDTQGVSSSFSNKKTEYLKKEDRDRNKADARETSRRGEREKGSQISYSSRHDASSSKYNSQESRSKKDYHRPSASRSGDTRKTSESTLKQNKTSESNQKQHKRSESNQKQNKTSESNQKQKKTSESTLKQKTPQKTVSATSIMAETIHNRSLDRNTSSKAHVERQNPVTLKSEVLSPKIPKTHTSELSKIVELLHEALKVATNSVDNTSVKFELEKITQLLKHALPTDINAVGEQFLIVLDVLEQALQRNKYILGGKATNLTSIISLLKNSVIPMKQEKENAKASMKSVDIKTSTQPSTESRNLSEIKVKKEIEHSDQFAFITQLLQKALKTYADSMEQGVMKTQLTVISQSLEAAATTCGKTTQEEQVNLLKIIELLERLLTANQPSLSKKPVELLGIMHQLKHALQSKPDGRSPNIKQNTPKLVSQTSKSPSFSSTLQNTSTVPDNQKQSELLQILRLLQRALHSHCGVLEQGYQKDKLAQISQMLDSELKEHLDTTSPDQLKVQISPLLAMLQQTLEKQQSSTESKGLLQILQQIKRIMNPPVTVNPFNVVQPANMFGNLQLQMLQTLQQQMQGGPQLGMGLPFQPVPAQTTPANNHLLQLQMMQMMQQMQTQQPSGSGQLGQLSQQLQAMQQQLLQQQVFQQQNQQPFQQPFQQQRPLLQSFSEGATTSQPQPDLSRMMMQLQQQVSQQYKGSD